MDRAARACRIATLLIGVLVLSDSRARASAPTYSFDLPARRLLLSASGPVHLATSPEGFLTLTSEGLVQSGDPTSPHFAVELTGLTGEAVREIEVSDTTEFSLGPFVGRRLTVSCTKAVELKAVLSLIDRLSVVAPDITVSGEVRVPGTSQGASGSRGGDIRLLGDRVTLGATARIDSSGTGGGGRILLGGDYMGGHGVPTAVTTRIAKGAVVRADALARGNGGRVIVWADELTAFHGHVSARGGSEAGDGGFVGVSGKARLDFVGTVDTDAPNGSAGTLLMDPANISIQAMSPDINGDTTTGDDMLDAGALDNAAADFPGANSIITDGRLEVVLQSGNVVLAATNDIAVNSVINLNTIGANPRTLTFTAGRNIVISGGGGVSATGASTSLSLVMNADSDSNNTGRFFTQGNIETNGGSLTVVARDTVTTAAVLLQADITTNGGDIALTGTNPTTDIRLLTGTDVSVGTGNLTLTGNRISIEAATSLAGTGALTIQPLTASTAMLLGGAGSTNTDFLTAAELVEINTGFSSFTIGRADSTGTITVHSTGVTFTDPTVLRTAGATNIDGVLTITDGAGVTLQNGGSATLAVAAAINADGPVAFSGPGSVTLSGPITSASDAIAFSSPVVTSGALVTLEAATNVTFDDSLAINGANVAVLPVVGNLMLGPAATLQLTALTASQFDTLSTTGSVTLGGTLTPTFSFMPQSGNTLLFIDNDAADGVGGAFSNRAPGSVQSVSGTAVALEHTLGDGNDVGFVAFTNGADLQIVKTNDRSSLIPGEPVTYAIVVANAGPSPANGAVLSDLLPVTLTNGSWTCVQAQSTATCPSPDAGTGDLETSVDLGVSQYLRFDVMATVDAAVNQTVINTATIAPPPGTLALNPGNDGSTDSDAVVPERIHKDGFEASSGNKLTVPGAADALH